ncbi:MAG: ATP-binding protein [Bacteroidales bacterium]|nr:ATP-binding protein [Bacteroidales bacterium]MBQ9702121.1 ATP-binding protein [Bacteroidales bacterium]
MEKLYERHDQIIRDVPMEYIRDFEDKIDWDARLSMIKGPKGVGKSTLIQQHIRSVFGTGSRKALYISADSGYFSTHSLMETAESFVRMGGTHLFIDEVHKYEGWSGEVKEIYDTFRDLRTVISGSSLLQLNDGKADLSRRVSERIMPGLSFREFLLFEANIRINPISLAELLQSPAPFCSSVLEECHPLEFLPSYLKYGYYPFFLESRKDYFSKVENVVNYIIDVELPRHRRLEVGNTRKVKALLQVLSTMVPYEVDIAKLSRTIGIERKTVLLYLTYLQEASLIRRLFTNLDTITDLQKPDKILLDNTNLLYALSPETHPKTGTVRESFFCNQLASAGYALEYGGLKTGDFRINKNKVIEVGGPDKDFSQVKDEADAYVAVDGIEAAIGRKIPLWAFGFLY